MRRQPERKASNGNNAESKKIHDESAGVSDHSSVYADDGSRKLSDHHKVFL